MKKFLRTDATLDAIAAVIAIVAFCAVLQSFLIGKHFVIPTAYMALVILIGNFARFGANGHRWAKHVLFWLFFLFACHLFFALFYAITPREMLGDAFLAVYGSLFAIVSSLCWLYARANRLFA